MKKASLLGAAFIIISGIIYTVERVVSLIASSIYVSGWHSGGRTGEVPQIEVNGFFDNLFVPGFLLIGAVLVIFGLSKKFKSKR